MKLNFLALLVLILGCVLISIVCGVLHTPLYINIIIGFIWGIVGPPIFIRKEDI